jgi:hypothetical protein
MKLVKLFFVLSMLSALPLLSGCSLDEVTQGGGGGGGGGGGSGDDSETENIPSTEFFEVQVNTSSEWDVVISKNGDGSTACKAEAGEDAFCVVDMPELDMFFRGFTMNDALPGDMCEYRRFVPYFYNIAPVGVNPGAVFYEEDSDGVLITPATAVPAGVGATADIWYNIAGRWYTHAQLYGAAATSKDDLRCPFDYTDIFINGRNCCPGFYTLMVRSNGEVNNTPSTEWGGSLANCFEGPGMDSYAYKYEDELPADLITAVDPDDGLLGTFEVTAPIEKVELDQPQIYAANYYKSSEHSGSVPGALAVIQSYRNWGSSAHYVYECLDAYHEVVARIRVVAREWNLVAEYEKLIAGTSANSDSEGQETDPTNSEADSETEPTSPYNDYCDWRDIEEADDGLSYSCDDVGGGYQFFGFGDLSTVDSSAAAGVQPLLDVLIPRNHDHYIGFAD